MTKAGSAMQMGARAEFRAHMDAILTKKPWIGEYCANVSLL